MISAAEERDDAESSSVVRTSFNRYLAGRRMTFSLDVNEDDDDVNEDDDDDDDDASSSPSPCSSFSFI